ncbi:MAG: MFS transporter, partial [Proteobacteria bacterium]|nr:MFS transporter [Pseudomonadota bacterium]
MGRGLDPNRPLGSLLLALLTTAGIFYVNIIAALIAQLRESLGFSAQIAGLVGSANIYGAAIGSFAVALFSRRWPWRPTAAAALICMIVLDLVSIFIRQPIPLMGLRVVHGMAGGVLVGTGLSLIART